MVHEGAHNWSVILPGEGEEDWPSCVCATHRHTTVITVTIHLDWWRRWWKGLCCWWRWQWGSQCNTGDIWTIWTSFTFNWVHNNNCIAKNPNIIIMFFSQFYEGLHVLSLHIIAKEVWWFFHLKYRRSVRFVHLFQLVICCLSPSLSIANLLSL